MSPKIYFLYGNQQLHIEETVDSIIASVLESRNREYSLERFDVSSMLKNIGENTVISNVDQFLLSCDTIPFFSDRKLIRLDHVECLKSPGKEQSFSAEGRLFQAVLHYLEKPPEYCWFIFTSTAIRDADLSSPFLKAIKQPGYVTKKLVAYDDDAPVNWVMSRGQQKGISLQKATAELMIDLMGNQLEILDQELEKLALLLGNSQQITNETLLDHIHGQKHSSVFRITQSLSKKELLPTLETLDQILLETPKEHVRLFALVTQQFRKLLGIHYLLHNNAPEQTILKRLGVHPFLGKQMMAQAKNFTLHELEMIMNRLASMDLPVKYQAAQARLLMQDLFQKICYGQWEMR